MRYNSVRSGQRVLHMTLRLIRTGWNRRGKAAAAREQGLELDYGRDAKRIKELIEQPGEGPEGAARAWFVKDAEGRIMSAPANPADDLRAALKVASRAAMEYGATQAQINFIVSLAIKNNDFNVLGSAGRLTKGEASRIIDEMKK